MAASPVSVLINTAPVCLCLPLNRASSSTEVRFNRIEALWLYVLPLLHGSTQPMIP